MSIDDVEDRWLVSLVLAHLDYEAQLIAIRELLQQHLTLRQSFGDEIKALEAHARRFGDEQSIDEWVEHVHHLGFQDAAHSMAATGMLAPFTESLFKVAFRGIEALLKERGDSRATTVRASMDANSRWDCSLISARRDGNHVTDLVGGVSELAAELGLGVDLPADLRSTMAALFGYRNKMFHNGFEWPEKERTAFQNRAVAESWPERWFSKATTNDAPWMFYLSPAFVDHCLGTIDGVLDGLGRFLRRLHDSNGD